MRLTLSESKIPLSGAACAVVAGLLLGGAMQPHLDDGDDDDDSVDAAPDAGR